MRVRGRGVPASGRNAAGDLLVTVDVTIPKKLSKEQRALVERLATALNEEVVNDRTQHQHAVYVISVFAEIAGVHPQTLRNYERSGLLNPKRTSGGSRRFSDADLVALRRIQELTNAGVNLEGVKRIMALEAELGRGKRGSPTSPMRRSPASKRPPPVSAHLVPVRTRLPCSSTRIAERGASQWSLTPVDGRSRRARRSNPRRPRRPRPATLRHAGASPACALEPGRRRGASAAVAAHVDPTSTVSVLSEKWRASRARWAAPSLACRTRRARVSRRRRTAQRLGRRVPLGRSHRRRVGRPARHDARGTAAGPAQHQGSARITTRIPRRPSNRSRSTGGTSPPRARR